MQSITKTDGTFWIIFAMIYIFRWTETISPDLAFIFAFALWIVSYLKTPLDNIAFSLIRLEALAKGEKPE